MEGLTAYDTLQRQLPEHMDRTMRLLTPDESLRLDSNQFLCLTNRSYTSSIIGRQGLEP